MVVYPVFAVAAIINLAGGRVEPLSRILLISCLLYPVLYFGSLVASGALRRQRKRLAALVVSGVPLHYIGLIALIALVTLLVEGAIP